MGNNIPAIAEKVKFWEEQDKINQAVIPRIIEMNDSLKRLASQLGTFDTKIAESESRIQNRFDPKIEKLTSQLNTFDTKIANLESHIQNKLDPRLDAFEAKIAESETLIQNMLKANTRSPKIDRIIAITAIIISVLSLFIALLK